MKLNDEQIKKFQELYKNRFGQEISRDEAFEMGIKLVNLVKIILQKEN